MTAARLSSLPDSPSLGHATGLVGLVLVVLGVLAVLVLLTGWTAWRVYRQPTTGRLVEHGVLLQLWLWVWIIAGPSYHRQWGCWLPVLLLPHLLLLAGRIVTTQPARQPRE